MSSMVEKVREKYRFIQPYLDERGRRQWAACEAVGEGRGGITKVAEATGLSRATVRSGMRELHGGGRESAGRGKHGERSRRPGGGRKRAEELDPSLVPALEMLLEPATRGDPGSPLRWTCKSAEQLASALRDLGHTVSERTVNRLLHDLDFSLQANRKTLEGRQHPDRDARFRRIHRRVCAFQRMGQPVVSVDARKKELIGRHANTGREWNPKGHPEEVRVHDFPDPEPGKAIPCGTCDLTMNSGWVSVGIDHDTGHQVVVNLIAATRTGTGLTIRAGLDPGTYPLGVKVTDEEVKALNIRRPGFHGEWNYTLMPRC